MPYTLVDVVLINSVRVVIAAWLKFLRNVGTVFR